MKPIVHRVLAALMASGICVSAWATVSASLDKSQVALGDRVRLVIQNTGNGDGQPDTGALRQDFDILGTQRGTSMQITNGHMSSQTQFTMLLAPKHEGMIHIAPIQWGGEQSVPLDLTVGAGASGAKSGTNSGAANTAESQITMSGTLDQKQPYVQSAVVLNLRLSVGVQMAQASLDFQGNSDVLVRQLGQDQQHTESRNGRANQVIERKYVLIPQRSGAISIKGPTLQAQVQDESASADDSDIDAFFGNVFGRSMGRFTRPMRAVHLQANAIEMNVQPRPSNANSSDWLPAQKLTLEESWRPDQGTLHVGEPLTRHLHLSALGLTAGQLPDLSTLMPVPDGIKKYPDQAKTDEGLQGDTLRASRDQDVALIASAPGHYVLPAFSLVWWDTVNRAQHTIELPEHAIDILPATGAVNNFTGAAPNATATSVTSATPLVNSSTTIGTNNTASNESSFSKSRLMAPTPWLWISAALSVLWIGTLLFWWHTRRAAKEHKPAKNAEKSVVSKSTPAASRSPSAALSALQRACNANDPRLARQHILEWANATWPKSPPHGLNSLAERLKGARYALPLQQLDRACYTDDAPWNGAMLAQAFSQPPKSGAVEKGKSHIPELYE